MSHAYRGLDTLALYVAVWRVASSLLCFSSTPWRLPFSLSLAGGKWEFFCSGGGVLGEAVKAATVWPFISPEKEGEKIEREKAGGRRGGGWCGVPMGSLDTDGLVNQPQRGRG